MDTTESVALESSVSLSGGGAGAGGASGTAVFGVLSKQRSGSVTAKQFEEARTELAQRHRTRLRISNLTWGMPSKLDTALLAKPNGGPFSVDYLASNVARMGLRDMYLRCMTNPAAGGIAAGQRK